MRAMLPLEGGQGQHVLVEIPTHESATNSRIKQAITELFKLLAVTDQLG